jgi:hypothetical protein
MDVQASSKDRALQTNSDLAEGSLDTLDKLYESKLKISSHVY